MTTEQEIKMFGEPIESMKQMCPYDTNRTPVLVLTYAAGIISDAQEVLAMGNAEMARQFMNKAKFFIAEVSTAMMEKI